LLDNLYLHILDRIWKKGNLQQRLGAQMVRYADDIVILCRRTKSVAAMATLKHVLDRLGLKLNEAKTKMIDTFKDRFDFLDSRSGWGRATRRGSGRRQGIRLWL
jgi:RNA-directed DNA polymerase